MPEPPNTGTPPENTKPSQRKVWAVVALCCAAVPCVWLLLASLIGQGWATILYIPALFAAIKLIGIAIGEE